MYGCSQVLDEFRVVQLTQDTHAFLHGSETAVPGSWMAGKPACGSGRCAQLPKQWAKRRAGGATWAECWPMECVVCQKERSSRCRVLPNQPSSAGKLQREGFDEACCIVANNDVRTEINKNRARLFGKQRGAQVQWVMAQDRISSKALAIDPDLGRRKVEFLQFTDRTTGNLSGLVPLVPGMPVFLTEHVDRSPEYGLLKGTRCILQDWVLHEEEVQDNAEEEEVMLTCMVPCALVSVPGASWHLEGMPHPGWYPIRPVAKEWFVDREKLHPKLKITRRQLPLCPAFAATANFAQGQNLGRVLADVNIAAGTSPQTCYVALSRVRQREHIYLVRSFPLEMFQTGQAVGPKVFLQYLRGAQVDWGAVTDTLLGAEPTGEKRKWKPHLLCAGCGLQEADEFSRAELERGVQRRCKACARDTGVAVQKQRCATCAECGQEVEAPEGGEGSMESPFVCPACKGTCTCCKRQVPGGGLGSARRCPQCMKLAQCLCCLQWVTQTRRKVNVLCESCQGAMPCGRCTLWKSRANFSLCERQAPSSITNKKRRRCNDCHEEESNIYINMNKKVWSRKDT